MQSKLELPRWHNPPNTDCASRTMSTATKLDGLAMLAMQPSCTQLQHHHKLLTAPGLSVVCDSYFPLALAWTSACLYIWTPACSPTNASPAISPTSASQC
mmetsp:Transcript_27551/g.70176  ORF Transcript_27551/g.70176 Transcript_27551/m.70176 type:complete len:100 (-) Transcript_27551:3047-3346(-)